MLFSERIQQEIQQQEQIQTLSDRINSYEINHIVIRSIYNEVKNNMKQLEQLKASDGEIVSLDNQRVWKIILPGPTTGSLHVYEKEQAYLNKLNVPRTKTYQNDEATYQLIYRANRFNCDDGWELTYIGKERKSFVYFEIEKSKHHTFGSHCICKVKINASKTLKRYMEIYQSEACKEGIKATFYPQLLVEHKKSITSSQRKFIKFDQFDTWYACEQDTISEIEKIYIKIELHVDL